MDLELQMGFCEVDITPQGPVETIGFGREDNRSKGVLHPLCAQVTVWKAEEKTCCLIALDHIGFSKAHARDMRDRIGRLAGIESDKVMLCFSHGHSSPNDDAEPEYYEFVCRRALMAFQKAFANLHPVTVGWNNAFVDIGLNRRKGNDNLDRRAGILKVCDAQTGRLRLILLRLTAHCNVLKRDNYLISPDYFGTVRDKMQEKYQCPIMVIQGAAGNIAPRYFHSATNPLDAPDERFCRTEEALDKMAEEVLANTAQVIRDTGTHGIGRMHMHSRRLSLISDVPSWERALEIQKEAALCCGINGEKWLEEVQRLHKRGITSQEDTIEVQYFAMENPPEGPHLKGHVSGAWSLADCWCLCGVANEIMVEFALEASLRLHNDFFYLNGYTNGCTGYFPTEEEFDLGGYEVYWSMLSYYVYYDRVFPYRRESASEFVRFVVDHTEEAG